MSHYNVNKQIDTTNGIPNIAFHPQLFENINTTPGNKSDLRRVQSDRTFRVPNVDVSDLKSPGMWQLTDTQVKQSGNASNTNEVMRNIHIENPLRYLYISERNVNDLQDLIRFTVFKQMGQVIDKQSRQELLIVMRAMYLQYGRHTNSLELAKSREDKDRILDDTVSETRRLNELVINETVPRIASQLQQYIDYLRDASTQPVLIDHQVNDSIKGQKNYRSTTQVLLGGNF
ncbi:hypothetical protein SAGO17_0093 [Mimivirus AB-566-O17]|uniref:Minor capsid protein P8 central region domain-containing protein n=1 Tax=Mimivirus AB-566-O17 TaxID=1988039 RepID=A0A1X9VNW2_9VIRU|nr:hypothetical protein SAGO17_0093 [Mimivirus AB-566-O17]